MNRAGCSTTTTAKPRELPFSKVSRVFWHYRIRLILRDVGKACRRGHAPPSRVGRLLRQINKIVFHGWLACRGANKSGQGCADKSGIMLWPYCQPEFVL